MKNWAQNLEFFPSEIISPKNTDEIKNIVKKAQQQKQNIRLRGSTHSWTGLIETKDIYINLEHITGITKVDKENRKITALAGTPLKDFGDAAFMHDLSMDNQGDINKQTLAGATSTGTHGTGINLQSMSNQITEVKIISASGEDIVINDSHPAFEAARLSLGSIGILSEITIKLQKAYKLKVKVFPESYESAIEKFEARIKEHRHLEMFYFPVGQWSLTKTMDKTEENTTPTTLLDRVNETLVENWLYTQLNRVASTTGHYQLIDKVMSKFVSPIEKVNWAHEAFPTQRSFKFMEMEYNLPVSKFQEVMTEIREAIKKNKFQTLFPIEIRFVKSDNIWLSPAYERDSVYFAVHTYISENYRPYFECIEEIFQRHQGRPHWGKWHSMTAQKLQKVYPKFEDFLKVREEFDPEGRFLNPHLKEIFGI